MAEETTGAAASAAVATETKVEETAGAAAAPSTDSGSGSFDMASAVEKVADGLGLKKWSSEEASAPPPAPSPAPVASPAPTSAPVAATPGQPAPPDLSKPPLTWRNEAKAFWDQLPEGARAEVLKREQDMWRGLEQYKGEAKFSKDVKTALGPVAGFAKHAGIDPVAFVGEASRAVATLADTRIPMAQRQAHAFQLMKALGVTFEVEGATGAAAPAAAGDNIENHPVVKGLRSDLKAVISRIQNDDAATAADIRARLSDGVTQFAADPANPYFYEVADDIAGLLKSGVAKTLKEAYEKAVMANPTTRAKEVARLTDEAVAKARKADTEKAQQARRASSANVNQGQHRAVPTATASGSMEDTMKATLKAINERGSK